MGSPAGDLAQLLTELTRRASKDRARLLAAHGDGDDVVIVAIGELVHAAVEAADDLASQGVSAAVVNARFVKPLDAEGLLPIIERCGALVTVEVHTGPAGFGGAVLEMIAQAGLQPAARMLSVPDRLVEHGSTLAGVGLDADGIVRAVLELIARAPAAGTES